MRSRTPAQIVKLVNSLRQYNRISVRLSRAEPSYQVQGGELTDPPPSIALLLAKALFFRMWATLYFPINWSREPGARLALATLVYVICLLRLMVVRGDWRKVALALSVVLVSALPPIQQLLIGQDLQKARLLYLPSLGFCWLLAALLAGLRGREQWIVGAGIIIFNLSVLSHNLTPWNHASVRAKTACEGAARCARNSNKIVVADLPDSIEGVYFFRNGFAECLEMERPDRPIAVDFQQGNTGADDPDSILLVWNRENEDLSCPR